MGGSLVKWASSRNPLVETKDRKRDTYERKILPIASCNRPTHRSDDPHRSVGRRRCSRRQHFLRFNRTGPLRPDQQRERKRSPRLRDHSPRHPYPVSVRTRRADSAVKRPTGPAADYLSSQGSLLYEPEQGLLIAVNAGSDSISVFGVLGARLSLREILPSGGEFPASIAISHDVVYVLDAGGEGAVSGYYVVGGFLVPIPGSTRDLRLGNSNPPNFLSSPGEVAFSPDGSQLLVTTKFSTNSIDVFHVGPFGLLSATPVMNTPSTTQAPFALTFAPDGQVVVAQAATSSLATYTLSSDGTLTNVSTVPDGQSALCWVTEVGGFYYVANAGSGTVSVYTISFSGPLSLVGIVASTGMDSGTIDMAATPDGSTLYVEAGAAGAVDEFHVNGDGSLTPIGSVTGLGAGIEGIAVS